MMADHLRFGTKYGVDLKLEDSLAAALVDQNPGGQKVAMGGMSADPVSRAPAGVRLLKKSRRPEHDGHIYLV